MLWKPEELSGKHCMQIAAHEERAHGNQADFRPGQGCIDHISIQKV